MSPTARRFFFFNKKEIACHSLLFHYKGEGFTCDLSAREPLVCSRLENLKWSCVLHASVLNGAHFTLLLFSPNTK